MSINIGCHPVDATFDSNLLVSEIPSHVVSALFGMQSSSTQLTLPVMSTGSLLQLTTLITFNIMPQGTIVKLGHDWFASYQEHTINSNAAPPSLQGFSLGTTTVRANPDVTSSSENALYNCSDCAVITLELLAPSEPSSSRIVPQGVSSILNTLFVGRPMFYAFDPFDTTILPHTLALHGLLAEDDAGKNKELLAHHLLSGLCGAGLMLQAMADDIHSWSVADL
ncbi:hypothetical protein DXG01_014256 [Tephrocybe rancida]|nr:hypothetical protein DXG01_014256 [Tephrocybe rancida]